MFNDEDITIYNEEESNLFKKRRKKGVNE